MARIPLVIADASALIRLGRVDQLRLLPAFSGRIVVPPAVAAEVTRPGSTLPSRDELLVRGFRLNRQVYSQILTAAGEEA